MRIAPINTVNRNYKQNFNAALYVHPNAYRKSNETSRYSFDATMDKFRETLSKDPLHPEDIVVVSPLKHDVQVLTSKGKKSADLKVSIDDYSAPFYYNTDRTTTQIAEDLYNTYKHVRYMRHYALK